MLPFNLKKIWYDLMVYDNANWDDEITMVTQVDSHHSNRQGRAKNPPR